MKVTLSEICLLSIADLRVNLKLPTNKRCLRWESIKIIKNGTASSTCRNLITHKWAVMITTINLVEVQEFRIAELPQGIKLHFSVTLA